MYTSVYDGIEATALYQQTPGILAGLLFVIVGAALLLVGAGAVARGLRCRYCAIAGLASLAGAAFVRGATPAASYSVLYGIAACAALTGPLAVGALGARLARIRA